MLRKYKNGLLDVIRAAGYDPADFDVTDEADLTFTLVFKKAPFTFIIYNDPENHHGFDVSYTQFAPGLEMSDRDPAEDYAHIDFVYAQLERWLKKDISEYFEDQSTPDLWEQISNQRALTPSGDIAQDEFEPFTEEEKIQIRLGLAEFQLQIKESFEPNEEQLERIEARLDYLSGALDRLNRFDWKSTLISTTMSISIALSLDTHQGQLLWALAKNVISTVLRLTQ